MNKLVKKTFIKILMLLVIIMCDFVFLELELLFWDYDNGRINFIEHEDYFNYGLTQDDLNKLDIADYKIFDYLDEQSTYKSVVYYNTKLCQVFAIFPCENFSKERFDELLNYSNIYFYDKFGPEIYQYNRKHGYGYSYDGGDDDDYIIENEKYYGCSRVYPTQRRVFLSNLYMKFESSIRYYSKKNEIHVSLYYSILNEIA